MRKILSLLVLLLMTIVGAGSAWAEFTPVEGKAYQFKNVTSGLYLNVRVDGTNFNGAITSKDVVIGTAPQAFYFTAKDGAFTITTAEGLYVGGHTNDWNMCATREQLWQVEEVDGGYAFRRADAAGKYIGFDASAVNGDAAYRDKSYSAKSGVFTIEECTSGSFVASTYKTFVTSPVPTSDAFANGTKFYTIQCKGSNGYLASDRTNANGLALNDATATTGDEGKWALVQTGKGLQLYNKASGTSKVVTFGAAANDAYASMGNDVNAALSYNTCVTARNANFNSGYECFKLVEGTDIYWNNKSNTLATWNSEQALWGWGYNSNSGSVAKGDNGSSFKFTMVEDLSFNTFTFELPDGVTATYKETSYTNGSTVDVMGAIATTEITISPEAPAGFHYEVTIDAGTKKVIVTAVPNPVLGTSDIDPNKAYYIYTVARGGLTIKSADDTRLWGTKEEGVNQTVDPNDERQHFAFVTYNGNLYLYSIGAGKFVNSSATGKLEDVPTNAIDFKDAGNGTVRLVFKDGDAINFNLGGSNQMAIGTWAIKDDGNKFIILPADDFNPAPVLEALNSATFVDVTYMVTNVDGVEVPYVVEHVKTGELAAIPEISGYLTDPVMTDVNCIVSETNNTFHVSGTWEFPFDETKFYTMKATNSNKYVCDGTHAWYNNSVAVADNNDVWQFAHVAGTLDLFTVKNYGHNKYAVLSGSGRHECTFAEAPTVWTEGTGATSYFRVVKQTSGFNLQHPGDATTNVGSHVDDMFGSWQNVNSATNGASINVITETTPIVPAVKANITYVYKLGEETVAEETNAVAIDSELPAPTANLPFYTYTAPEGTVSTDKTYTINLTWDGPFQTDGTTYALGVRLKTDGAANYYVKAQGEGEKVLSRALESVEPSAEALWTFERVAGTADQFYVKNMKFGYINTASGATSTTVAETKTPMVLYAYTGTNHKDGNKDFGFYDVTNNGQIFGDHQTVSGVKYLGYWAGGSKTDAGSAFQVVPTEFVHYDWAAYEARYNKLNACTIGENLGEYADVLKYLEDWEGDAPLSAWKNYFYLTLTYKEEANYDADMENMQWFLDHMQLNLPQKGQMLRIKTSSNWMSEPTYLAGEKASNDHLKFVQNPDFNAEAEDNTIWIYDGQYLINYANGLTFATTAAQYGHATLEMYPNTTAVSFQAAQNGTVGKYNVKFAGNRFMYTQNNNLPNLYTDAGSTANSEGYNFELEDATTYFFLDFGDKGWASGYFPIPVAANPEYGIDAAYYIKNNPENNCFQAEPVGYEGHGLIAPFTPVIIQVNAEINGGRPLVKGAPDFSMQPEPSALSGALWKQEKPANCLVFNVVDEKPGFYGYSGTTLKHMKAYYVPSAPTESALRINFGEDDTLTGIMEAIEKAEFSGNVFDLQGRRINGVQKGVFVKDGKKVIK